MNLKKVRIAITVLTFSFAGHSLAEKSAITQKDIYSVDDKTNSLNITWPGGSKSVAHIVGTEGENTRALIDFNGGKALFYENLASRSAFRTYFTLVRQGREILIDCIYSDVRNDQNGVLINKAVCGLKKPLVEDYEDLAYTFTDEWKKTADAVVIDPLLSNPVSILNVDEADFGATKLRRVYDSLEDLSSSVPETLIDQKTKKHLFGLNPVFSVYQANALNDAVYLDVSSDNIANKFSRYDKASLSDLLR
ncbi:MULTISPECIES: hypothetical protein [Pseudomonas]|uniref:Uncharacterized protein n=1 Tax=Pseudomonas kitaguniensis TaxID=2607908 RepID=A0A5N7KGF9_9PSED|nr:MULTISPECIES: hypothetical protein [Pseudomonas]MPR00775.1 hypothetical protein [Pseudomonas kitaguniensis]